MENIIMVCNIGMAVGIGSIAIAFGCLVSMFTTAYIMKEMDKELELDSEE